MLDILASGRLDAHQQGVPVDADPPRQRQLGWLALQTVLAQPFGKFLLTAVALAVGQRQRKPTTRVSSLAGGEPSPVARRSLRLNTNDYSRKCFRDE